MMVITVTTGIWEALEWVLDKITAKSTYPVAKHWIIKYPSLGRSRPTADTNQHLSSNHNHADDGSSHWR